MLEVWFGIIRAHANHERHRSTLALLVHAEVAWSHLSAPRVASSRRHVDVVAAVASRTSFSYSSIGEGMPKFVLSAKLKKENSSGWGCVTLFVWVFQWTVSQRSCYGICHLSSCIVYPCRMCFSRRCVCDRLIDLPTTRDDVDTVGKHHSVEHNDCIIIFCATDRSSASVSDALK